MLIIFEFCAYLKRTCGEITFYMTEMKHEIVLIAISKTTFFTQMPDHTCGEDLLLM